MTSEAIAMYFLGFCGLGLGVLFDRTSKATKLWHLPDRRFKLRQCLKCMGEIARHFCSVIASYGVQQEQCFTRMLSGVVAPPHQRSNTLRLQNFSLGFNPFLHDLHQAPALLQWTYMSHHKQPLRRRQRAAHTGAVHRTRHQGKSIDHISLGASAAGCRSRRAALTCRRGRLSRKLKPSSRYSR